MCGLCGIVDLSGRPIDKGQVVAMRDLMWRRGPDEAGLAQLPFATLGFRRLAILDLSAAGHQPMSNADESLWLVFNGEIYNYRTLRQELEDEGYPFRSRTDSEVLLHGYHCWGMEELLQRLNGMYAFAIWDVGAQRLSAARDRSGKKPLYYAKLGERFFFASDIKSIWKACGDDLSPCEESIARFLYWGSVPGPGSIWKQVQQLEPAHWMRLDRDGLEIRRYWRLSFADKERGSEAELIEHTDRLVGAAVQRRLESDVPLGAYLSGGVDSSTVVGFMAEYCPEKVRSYCASFDHDRYDESEVARAVARHVGTEHSELPVRMGSWEILPRLVWEFGQPFSDPAALPLFYLTREARQHITVVLTGDGGDEAFAGYSQHQGYYRAAALRRIAPAFLLDGLVSRLGSRITSGARGSLGSLLRFLRYASSDRLAAWASPGHWCLDQLAPVWLPSKRRHLSPELLLGFAEESMRDHDGESALDWAQAFDFATILPYRYNVKVDVATMASSVEARSPFLDTQVLEWAARLPEALRISGGTRKRALKEVAARRIPREILERPKHGFGVPINEWLRGSWRDPAAEILFSPAARERGLFDLDHITRLWAEHQSGVRQHGNRFLMLLWLELWFQIFVDRTRLPDPDWAAPAAQPESDSA